MVIDCFFNVLIIGNLFGVHSKMQPTPKPIYNHSRVVLRLPGKVHATPAAEDGFINANEVYPNLIMTQCPLVDPPPPAQSTLSDALLMIIQRNISTWIQIMSPGDTVLHESLQRRCLVFPLLNPHTHLSSVRLAHGLQVRDLRVHATSNASRIPHQPPYRRSEPGPDPPCGVFNFTNISFTVVQTRSQISSGTEGEAAGASSSVTEVTRPVQYLWYDQWVDFGVPREDDDEVSLSVSWRYRQP